MIETNIGKIDQMIRIVCLFIGALLYVFKIVTGFEGTIVGILTVYCFVTALTKYCPVWEMLGISTEKTFHRIVH
ncbi:MAG: DUF2892 domain-containing protein [Bacteroidota bacterium]